MSVITDNWPLILAALVAVILVTSIVKQVAKLAFLVVGGVVIFLLLTAEITI